MLAALHRVQVLCRPKTTPAHLSFPDRIGLAISSISMPSTRRSTRSASAATPKADVEKAAESGSTGAATLSGRKRARKQETQDEVAVDVKEAGPPAKKGRNAVKQGRGPKSTAAAKTKEGSPVPTENAGPRYWLYKSEPESRITESGHDVKFSIDDLVSRPNQTEPWDGVRNFAARNNLKAMRLGDRGFFYHSNCKEPGIVGIVEVVKEAVPDEQAFDPTANYYDPKSTRENPKWFQVEVKFIRKMKRLISLKELQEHKDKELSDMPLLKMGRLSVSEVPKNCWDYILELEDLKEAAEE